MLYLIRELAEATLNFENVEAWPLILKGLRARGFAANEVPLLRLQVWKVRQQLQREAKSRRKLEMIELAAEIARVR